MSIITRSKARSPDEAAFRSERRFLIHDLYQGLVTPEHPMWDWMVHNGVEGWELDWFRGNAVQLDILGLDYYQHSEHQLRRGPHGERIDETASQPFGWQELARQYSTRYQGIPVFLAETNVGGPVEERIAGWSSWCGKPAPRGRPGTPIGGITYYGAIDHVDWDSLLRVRNLNINPWVCGHSVGKATGSSARPRRWWTGIAPTSPPRRAKRWARYPNRRQRGAGGRPWRPGPRQAGQ